MADNLGSLTYLDDKKSPAVQMADLMAYEAMHKTVRWMEGRSEDRAAFIDLKPTVYKIEMADTVWLEEFVRINSAA